MINVAWTVLAKIRVQDALRELTKLLSDVQYWGDDHALPRAVREAMSAVDEVVERLDETYDVNSRVD